MIPRGPNLLVHFSDLPFADVIITIFAPWLRVERRMLDTETAYHAERQGKRISLQSKPELPEGDFAKNVEVLEDP